MLMQQKRQEQLDVLVVAPNGVMEVWRETAAKHLPDAVGVWTRRDMRKPLMRLDDEIAQAIEMMADKPIRIIVINYECLVRFGERACALRLDYAELGISASWTSAIA